MLNPQTIPWHSVFNKNLFVALMRKKFFAFVEHAGTLPFKEFRHWTRCPIQWNPSTFSHPASPRSTVICFTSLLYVLKMASPFELYWLKFCCIYSMRAMCASRWTFYSVPPLSTSLGLNHYYYWVTERETPTQLPHHHQHHLHFRNPTEIIRRTRSYAEKIKCISLSQIFLHGI